MAGDLPASIPWQSILTTTHSMEEARLLKEFVEHYQEARPHQGLD